MVAFLALLSFSRSSHQELNGWKLLDDASHRAFNYFVEQSNPKTGLTKDRSTNFGEHDDRVVASIAATGFALSAYSVGVHRGWMLRDEAVKRAIKTVQHILDLVPRDHGWLCHWVNWESGKREWKSEISTIDSAIFWSGLLLAERGLQDPELTRLTNLVLAEIDWKYFLTNGGSVPTKLTFSMGFRDKFLDSEWSQYSENAMLSLLALGTDPGVPSKTWESLERKRVTEFGKTGISGGPLFMHQLSHVFFDFSGKRDRLGIDYWANSRLMTLLQREYCSANPSHRRGYSPDIWGLSACDIPNGYGAQGFPAGYLGSNFENGTLAAPAALASMMFAAKESMAAAEAFYGQFRSAYGRYGFSSGINPGTDWHSQDVIGIDQGQMMLGIENARDGWPNKVFMSHPIAALGMKRAGFRVTNEGLLESRKVFDK